MVGNTLDEDIQLLERENRKLKRRIEVLRAYLDQMRGVAHDINGPTTAIVGFSGVLLPQFPKESKVHEYLEAMGRAALGLSKSVEAIHTLSRPDGYNLHTLDLNKIVYAFVAEPEYLWIKENHPDVRININCFPGSLYIKGSEEHLERLIFNFLRNAVEAVEARYSASYGNGEIKIETAAEIGRDPACQEAEQLEYAVLSVSDNGCGIAPENLARIFRTTFSTKNSHNSQKRGCGSMVIRGIVEEHKGYIDAHSEVGTGTQFKVYIPRLTDLAVAKEAAEQ